MKALQNTFIHLLHGNKMTPNPQKPIAILCKFIDGPFDTVLRLLEKPPVLFFFPVRVNIDKVYYNNELISKDDEVYKKAKYVRHHTEANGLVVYNFSGIE